METPATEAASSASNVAEYTVSELSYRLKRIVEGSFEHVRVRGEIGRVSRPASGHVYFDLKDERAVLAGVCWKGVVRGLAVQPEQGLEVIATGRLTTFPGQSKYQIVIERLEHAGVGALMALLEERKRKLAKEGLFDEARKRPLPFLPALIGIVTSPSGAVIRDMLAGFAERFPAHVLVWPVRVQGEESPREVAAAIRGFNAFDGRRLPRPDVLIVARGGGSLEDLWGFNDELVVRAVAESAIPVVSAIGHETDWTLVDLAADARAPTPTKAAEWVVPKHAELIARMAELEHRLSHAVLRALTQFRTRLKAAARGLPRPHDLVALARQRFDGAAGRLAQALRAATGAQRARFAAIAGRLGPQTLSRRLREAEHRLSELERRRIFAFQGATSQRRATLDGVAERLAQALRAATGAQRARFAAIAGRLGPQTLSGRVREAEHRLGELERRRALAFGAATSRRRATLDGVAKLLASLGYEQVLARGFALVRDEDGRMVRRAAATHPGQALEIQFADGRIGAEVRVPSRREGAPRGRAHNDRKEGRRNKRGEKRGELSERALKVSHKKQTQGSLF